MNTRNIQPTNLWTPSGEKEATILSLYNFYDYHFDDGGGKVSYKLIGMEAPEVGMPEVAVEYYSGVVDISAAIIQQWGASDDVIWTYVSNQLNLILI
jgi:hypothetical protein